MNTEKAISLLQRGLVGEIYDEKGYLTALGYEALDAIDSSECPTLVQKQHGEWHTTPNPNHSPFDSTSEVIYMCSRCAYSSGNRIAATWNFCPNCGADMREGDMDG